MNASLANRRDFWAMTITQFLGAFNDNLYKQVVMLLCVDAATQTDRQWIAQGVFALPFVLFSGFAGFLSDRHSKRSIVVLCKLAEILIVTLGTLALYRNSVTGNLLAVLAVLFCMGTHSAFFGPAKFGILPELFPSKHLPIANGVFLMTTFVGIILGTVAAGYLKEYWIPARLPLVGACYLAIATLGLLTALWVRRTPPANPALRLDRESLLISGDMLRLMGRDRPLVGALLLSSIFWMLGGIVQSAVNAFGERQLRLTKDQTSLMPGMLVLGISVGCALGGWLCGQRVNFRLVRWGAWGIIASLLTIGLVGSSGLPATTILGWTNLALLGVGISAGIYTVPLQVFLQSRPPDDKKGQMIGAMNLSNWIAILLAAGLYWALNLLLVDRAGSNVSRLF
ncbi:MAG: MFS transporter, partial [Planctomycetaceae bacterium]